MNDREFEEAYAARSGVTVEWLHAHGRRAKPCTCDDYDECEGWQMAHDREVPMTDAHEGLAPPADLLAAHYLLEAIAVIEGAELGAAHEEAMACVLRHKDQNVTHQTTFEMATEMKLWARGVVKGGKEGGEKVEGTSFITTEQDNLLRLAQQAFLFVLSDQKVFARFREFAIRRNVEAGFGSYAAMLKRALNPSTAAEAHDQFVMVIGKWMAMVRLSQAEVAERPAGKVYAELDD